MLKDKFKVISIRSNNTYHVERNDNGYMISWNDRSKENSSQYTKDTVISLIEEGKWVVIYDVEDVIQTEPIHIHKALDFNELTGRRFGMSFKRISDVKYKTPIQNINLRYIEGYIETFAPMGSVVLNDKEYGFNIIPYQLIVEMTEIFEVEEN